MTNISEKMENTLRTAKPILKKVLVIILFVVLIRYFADTKGIILLNTLISNGQNPNMDADHHDANILSPQEDGIALPYKQKCSAWKQISSFSKWLNIFNTSAKKLSEENESLEYSYVIWLKIFNTPENIGWNDNYKTPKILINRNYSPIILYVPATNSLRVGIQTNNTKELTFYEIPDFFKLQRWENLTVCLQERHLDIYLNGELVKSFILSGVPYLNDEEIMLFPEYGFNAEASLIMYYNKCLNPDEVKTYYDINKESMVPYNKHFNFQ
jgi:hypothetical protein